MWKCIMELWWLSSNVNWAKGLSYFQAPVVFTDSKSEIKKWYLVDFVISLELQSYWQDKHDYCNLLLELIASNGNYFAINTTLWNFLHSSNPFEKRKCFMLLQKTAWISHLIIWIEIHFMRIIWASGYKCEIFKI